MNLRRSNAMTDFFGKLFSSDFMPHGYCLPVESRSTVAASNLRWIDRALLLSHSVDAALFVRKRKDLPFNWIFVMFGVFILSCGTTHVMEIWTLWHGTY